MLISQLLQTELCLCKVEASSKKNLFLTIANRVGEQVPGMSADSLYENLLAREKLGSTGLGGGVAIPHCRMEHLSEPVAALVTLKRPVDFDASDNQAVDVLFVLCVPVQSTDEHLQLLAQISQLLSSAKSRRQLRSARSEAALCQQAKDLFVVEA